MCVWLCVWCGPAPPRGGRSVYPSPNLHANVVPPNLRIACTAFPSSHIAPTTYPPRPIRASNVQLYGVPYLKKPVSPPVNDGARSLAIIHVAIVQGSTGEPWRGPDGCGIHVGDGNTAPDPVSKSEKARL